jgi:voltage-dependent calcium channel N type alpha-1B
VARSGESKRCVLTACCRPGGSGTIGAIRALRLLRVFRLIRQWRTFRSLMSTMKRSIQQVSYFFLVLMLWLLLFAILGMQLFGGGLGSGRNLPRTNFETLWMSFVSMFQILTLENYNDLAFIVSARTSVAAQLFFIVFIIVGRCTSRACRRAMCARANIFLRTQSCCSTCSSVS